MKWQSEENQLLIIPLKKVFQREFLLPRWRVILANKISVWHHHLMTG